MFRRRIVLFVFMLFLLPAVSLARLTIIVEPDARWGQASVENIRVLLENVALHFQEVLRDEQKIDGNLTVFYHPNNPTFLGNKLDEYKIGIAVTDRYWDNFSYQFGHEFLHLMQHHDYDRKFTRQNNWFREALAELANLWVIRRMSETWAYRAPYDNWINYRHHLLDYANNWMMSRPEVQYAGTGAKWLAEYEDYLRLNFGSIPGENHYAIVAQLSYKFLPIFEENPEAWNAVRQMPASPSKMSDYMRQWYNTVDTEDKPYVKAIAEVMAIEIESTPLIANKPNTCNLLLFCCTNYSLAPKSGSSPPPLPTCLHY